jgi:hypothetical protein
MSESEIFEPEWHVFSGTVIRWDGVYGELLTDSGVTILLTTHGHPEFSKGARVTLRTRKYRLRYAVAQVLRTEPPG